jgi:hypothetical protein
LAHELIGRVTRKGRRVANYGNALLVINAVAKIAHKIRKAGELDFVVFAIAFILRNGNRELFLQRSIPRPDQ